MKLGTTTLLMAVVMLLGHLLGVDPQVSLSLALVKRAKVKRAKLIGKTNTARSQ